MGTACLANRSFGLFGDEVFTSADLNRRSSEVLNRARKNPVTINRNSEQFALLRRDLAADLVRASNQFGPTIELITAAISVVERKEPPTPFAWLKAFSVDDLRKMIREVLVACRSALEETGDWDLVGAIMHEWHESSLVAMSATLKEAATSPADHIPLPDPREPLMEETEAEALVACES